MAITGKYILDSNFINIYTTDMLYTVPRNARQNWSYIKVGQRTASGQILDAETFEKWKAVVLCQDLVQVKMRKTSF